MPVLVHCGIDCLSPYGQNHGYECKHYLNSQYIRISFSFVPRLDLVVLLDTGGLREGREGPAVCRARSIRLREDVPAGGDGEELLGVAQGKACTVILR